MVYPNTERYVGKRVIATIIDYLIVFALTFAFVFKFGTPDNKGGHTVTGALALIPVAFWFLYVVIAEAFLGGTFGHQILKLKVVSTDNDKPSFHQTLVRRVWDALEIAFSFGLIAYVLAKNTQNHQRLGDIRAKTLVTGKNEMPVNQFDFESKI